jgi:pimeloyl-ACP methyl ester carboxylesterase
MNIQLVHGLGRTPVSLFGLASALRKGGHRTSFFAYFPYLESLPHIVRRLAAKLESLGKKPIGVVGHSLGGILLRLALAHCRVRPVAHFAMLGTPNQPAWIARWAWKLFPFRLWTRECGRLLATAEEYATLPPVYVPYTVIAGTAGPCGRLSPFGPAPNDGVVCVHETPVDHTDTPLLVPAFHSFLMDDARVRQHVLAMMKASLNGPSIPDLSHVRFVDESPRGNPSNLDPV